MSDGVTPAAVLIETYALSVSPTLPAIPLFTLAGFLLAEGHASDAAAARVPRVVRLDSRRHGRGVRVSLLVLHGVHRRVGRHDSRARRRAVSGALEGRLSRAVLARPDDRVRLARTAAAAGAAAHPVRRRRADSDRGPVHRRHPAGHPADADDRGVGRARGHRVGSGAPAVSRG